MKTYVGVKVRFLAHRYLMKMSDQLHAQVALLQAK
jgi:hypothetical protein